MTKQRLSYEVVSQLVRYESDTGKLFWLLRDRKFFRDDRQFNTWNKRYSGKQALSQVHVRQGYLQGHLLGTFPKAHQIAWLLFYKEWPARHIDHIDGDPSNNRISNLRDVEARENCRNRRKVSSKSGVTGVYASRRRWAAHIRFNGVLMYIGHFETKEAAAEARMAKQIELGFTSSHGIRSFTGHNTAARLERALQEAAQ